MPAQLALTGEIHFYIVKSLEHQKNLKTGRVPYLSLEMNMHVIKSQTHLVTFPLMQCCGSGYGIRDLVPF
jgi:hypothetical protein